MKKVAIYARVSTAEQAEPGRLSIPDQLARCRQQARCDGCEDGDITEYVDRGVSGAKGEDDRAEFGRLMNDVRAGALRAVYFLALDRLSRDMVDSLAAFKQMEGYGVLVRSLREPYLDNELVRAMTAALAEMERKKIRERTSRGRQNKRDLGFWVMGAAPYGYRVNHTTQVLSQCPNEAPILRRIFDLAGRNHGRIQIARVLNAEGVPAPEIHTHDPNGKRKRVRVGHLIDDRSLLTALEERGLTPVKPTGGTLVPQWASSTVAKVLANPMAYGVRNDVRFSIDPGPVLTEAEFQAVQSALSSRKVAPGTRRGSGLSTRWLLTGYLTCSGCGSNYVHHDDARGHNRYCCGARRSGEGCRNPHTSMDAADAAVIRALRQSLLKAFPGTDQFRDHLQREARGRVHDLRRQLGTITADLETAHKERDRYEKHFRAGIDQGLPPEALSTTKRELREATATHSRLADVARKLSQQIGDITAGLIAQENEIGDLSERMRLSLMLVTDDGDPLTDLRRLLSMMLESAVVGPDKEVTVTLHNHERFIPEVLDLLATTELDLQRKMRFVKRA